MIGLLESSRECGIRPPGSISHGVEVRHTLIRFGFQISLKWKWTAMTSLSDVQIISFSSITRIFPKLSSFNLVLLREFPCLRDFTVTCAYIWILYCILRRLRLSCLVATQPLAYCANSVEVNR